MPIRIYSCYGSIGAPLGYSRGIDHLSRKLASLPGVTAHRTKVNWLSQQA